MTIITIEERERRHRMKREEDRMSEEEWRMSEKEFGEIPFSRLKMPDGSSGFTFLSSIKDTRSYNLEEDSTDNVVTKLLKYIDPAKQSVQDIIVKIASKPGCLTP